VAESDPFKWRHYQGEIILLCVRWYLRYTLIYRDLEEMMRERGLSLDNLIEQDHRFINRRVNAGLGFFSFKTAGRTIKGYEAMHMMRKRQIEGIGKGNINEQVRFMESLF
jgi:transposase-like protein